MIYSFKLFLLSKKTAVKLQLELRVEISGKGNVHKGRPTIMGYFGPTYLPMSYVFYTWPITIVRFLLRYLPTPKSDVLYERSQTVRFRQKP